MQTERRWLKSAIVASVEEVVCMPWQRDNRTRPEAMQPAVSHPVPSMKLAAMAAR